MNARQRAEYRAAIDKCQRATTRPGALPPPLPPEVLAPRSEPFQHGTPQELALATRLLPHVCADSVLDRRTHALGVARMILRMGARP